METKYVVVVDVVVVVAAAAAAGAAAGVVVFVAGVAGARVVGMLAVATVFFAHVSMPAALERVVQLPVGVDHSTEVLGVAAEGGAVRWACPGPPAHYTWMASAVYRHSRLHLGGLG